MPIIVFALAAILLLMLLGTVVYFSTVIIFKLFRGITSIALGTSASLPSSVRRSLREARQYAELIRKTAQQHPVGPMQDRLKLTIKPVDQWLANLQKLEQALGKIYAQRNLGREIRHVSFEMDQLHRQLRTAPREEIADIKSLLTSKQKHLDTLAELQSFQNQAEMKIRRIASDLGAAHAEMLLISAKGKFSDSRIQRLDENLQDQVVGLRDMITVMDDLGYSKVSGY